MDAVNSFNSSSQCRSTAKISNSQQLSEPVSNSHNSNLDKINSSLIGVMDGSTYDQYPLRLGITYWNHLSLHVKLMRYSQCHRFVIAGGVPNGKVSFCISTVPFQKVRGLNYYNSKVHHEGQRSRNIYNLSTTNGNYSSCLYNLNSFRHIKILEVKLCYVLMPTTLDYYAKIGNPVESVLQHVSDEIGIGNDMKSEWGDIDEDDDVVPGRFNAMQDWRALE